VTSRSLRGRGRPGRGKPPRTSLLPPRDVETADLFSSATSDRLFWVNFRARSRVRRRTIRHPGLQVRGAAEGHGWLQFLNQLGDGGFGTVYKGTCKPHRINVSSHFPHPKVGLLICRRFHGAGNLRDGRTVAIKRLYEHNCRRVEQFMTEVRILSSLRHPNLVTLYGCTSRRSRALLVYEYVPNGTVAEPPPRSPCRRGRPPVGHEDEHRDRDG
ncbi:unnamed protein product, partial [Musa acuminata subsp. burmannicoides]